MIQYTFLQSKQKLYVVTIMKTQILKMDQGYKFIMWQK